MEPKQQITTKIGNRKDIDETRYVESCLLRYENITTKIRMFYDRTVHTGSRQTYNQRAAAALDRAHKAYNALTKILKPTLEGWKKR